MTKQNFLTHVLGFAVVIFAGAYIWKINKGDTAGFLAIAGVGTTLITVGHLTTGGQ